MSIVVSYNTLANQLEKELSITVATREDFKKFRNKLSQAKHRQGIAGKLTFSVKEGKDEVGLYNEISVALVPVKNQVEIMAVKKAGDF